MPDTVHETETIPELGEFFSPASFWSPKKLVSSAWIEHVPFAFWLIDVLRPRRVVELGVFQGLSYFAFCQAIAQLELDTDCFGIDTWQGDEHGGFYGEQVFEAVSRHNADRYGDFSRLIRSTFDEAQTHFAAGTIDLLHIDGRHFYDDVKHDYGCWLKKLSPAAVVVFHDTNVHERGFGVAQLWNELRHTCPSFEFKHGHGLGVLCPGSEPPVVVHRLCTQRSPRMHHAVRAAYARLGRGIAEQFELCDLRADISRRQQVAESQLATKEAELATLRAAAADREAMRRRAAESGSQLATKEAELATLRVAVDEGMRALQLNASNAEAERDRFRHERDILLRSTFWRLTAPARRIAESTPAWLRFHARRSAKLLYWLITLHRTRQRIIFLRARQQHAEKASLTEQTAQLKPPLFWSFFDADWYNARYPEVAASSLAPLEHFLTYGAAKGLDPNPAFDTAWYLASNPDVARSGRIPLEHFVSCGAEEGRQPAPSFDPHFYRMQKGLQQASNLEAYRHYLTTDQPTGSCISAVSAIPTNAATPAMGETTAINVRRISIGIVAYRAELTQIRRLITSAQQSLARCGRHLGAEIRVLDNGATLKASDLPDGIELLSSAQNDGFGTGHNRCMEAAFGGGADAYIAANPDGSFHPDCLRSLLAMHCAHNGRALIEAQQFPEEHPKYYDPVSLNTPWVSGACLLIPRSLWEQTGGFDPAIFLYCEDVDLSWTARRLGFRTLMCPSALFWHDVSGRSHEDWRWREMLVAGRYLAHKWENPAFREWTERQLLEGGFALRLDELPPLEDFPTVSDGKDIADFSFAFHFAPVRW